MAMYESMGHMVCNDIDKGMIQIDSCAPSHSPWNLQAHINKSNLSPSSHNTHYVK